MRNFWVFDTIEEDAAALLLPGADPVTYGQLSEAADLWSERLLRLVGSLRPLVALELATTPDAVAAYLGVLRAGLPLLIVEPGQLGEGSGLTQRWRPDVLLTEGPGERTVLSERAGWRDEVAVLPPAHPALRILLSTSGSTGDPKLVRLSDRNIAANAASIAEYLQIRASDRAATTLPLFYSYGLSVLNSYLAAGAALVLISDSITEPRFWATARQAGVTSLAFVPHQFELLSTGSFDGTELPTLRYVTQAGGKLHLATVRHFWQLGRAAGWDLVLMYGQTEAAPRISYVPPEALPEAGDTIGRAIPGGRLWLAGDDGTEIGEPGRPGELVYEGPNVMMGYATSRHDLARDAELDELRTGDIAELTADGYFRMVGRLKRFVKLYGLRLSLDQVEALLRARDFPAHAVGVEDRLVLLCRSAEGMRSAAETVAAEYAIPPHEIHSDLLTDVPLLPSGKVDDQALRQLAVEAVRRSEQSRRTSTRHADIAEVIQAATRQAVIRPTDTFVGLGGDSLSYLEVQIELDDRLGAAPSGWERMTVAELDGLLRKGDPRASAEGARVAVGADVILRLVAISIIVVQHASNYPVFGGAWVLLAVMGFSAARFQVQQVASGRPDRLVRRMLYPIVPLYYLALLAYGLLREPAPVSYWLLLGNYEPWTGGSVLVVYWFVSVYVQIVLVLALVTAVTAARRAVVADPWRAATVATVVLLAALLATLFVDRRYGLAYVPQRGLVECLSIFAVGWMLRSRAGAGRTLATALLAAAVLSALSVLDMTTQVLVTLVVALAVLGVHGEVTVPRGAARALHELAALTLYVFLVHPVVISGSSRLDLAQPVSAVLALMLAFAVAAVAKHGFDTFDRAVLGRRRASPVQDSLEV